MLHNDFAIMTTFHWVGVVFYAFATIGNTWGVIFQKKNAEKIAFFLLATGLIIHGIGILFWWEVVGHGPYLARNEILSAMAWGTITVFLVFSKIFPSIRPTSILIFPSAILMIALGIFFSPAIKTLPPSYRGIWLVIHVVFYIISLATIVIALALSLGYVLKKRTQYEWLTRLPDCAIIDMSAYRFVGFGFVFWLIAMLAGSLWAYDSWGRFWGWDPTETWSLISLGLFGLYLHLRRFFGLMGEKAAMLFILCFIVSLISLFFIPLLESSIHSVYFR